MSQHFSPKEMSAWLAGERATGREQHLAECPLCREEAARMQTALGQFREAMREWSGRQMGSPPPMPASTAQPSRSWHASWRWTSAMASVLVVVTPSYWYLARQHAEERDREDALLLEQVYLGISRAVPASMEPLLELVSGAPDSTSSDTQEELK
jgi:hypothetical protein